MDDTEITQGNDPFVHVSVNYFLHTLALGVISHNLLT